MLNKILGLLGFIRCYLCKKLLHKTKAISRHFADSPKDFESGGYSAKICKSCDYWCEEHQRG